MDKIQRRFNELEQAAEEINASVKSHTGHVAYKSVDEQLHLRWRTSVMDLLSRLFGDGESVYTEFVRYVQKYDTSNTYDIFLKYRSIFLSAKDIYEGGYLFEVSNLVHAPVFSDEIEQAEHFPGLQWKIPAAVIAGTVLETTLRTLCEQNGIDKKADNGKDKMSNGMIDDLAKVPIFNKMKADLLRAWSKIRNSAAHGKPDEFSDADVRSMIDGIRDFVANQLS